MPEFKRAEEVEQICYEMRLSDYTRGQDRARIDELFNGFPPYSQLEVEENQIEVNVSFLEPVVIGHDARSQLYGAFMKPGNYFALKTDMGPVSKRDKWAVIVTNEMNKVMKGHLPYFECQRSKFAQLVLHGVGISAWPNQDNWCPQAMGMEDVLVPSRTYLTMDNLPFHPIYRSFTAPELMKLTRGPVVDPGWNKPLVEACLKWIDQETLQLMGSNWPEVWAPEKQEERVKGDGGFYMGDQVPTIDCWDFYYYHESDKESGWKRKIILDSWSTPSAAGGKVSMARRSGSIYDGNYRGQFLYEGKGYFAEERSQITAFQFADLSAVGPFQYHSVRGLGFLLYAVCHLQNRLRCRFSEAVFEALMMYFRVKTMDDVQRALKLNLVNRGFIDDTIQMVNGNDRYQVNERLVESGMQMNTELINRHSSIYRPERDYNQDKREKTATQVMQEANTTAGLASIALQQVYQYQDFEYGEIKRRFFKRNSENPGVKKFQAACLRRGVPEKYMQAECWEHSSERVMGAGNKTLEMAVANWLMQNREKYDPDAQRKILYDATLAVTDDASKADMLVPEETNVITNSVHDAQLAAGTLMQGLPVALKSGLNHIEYVQAMLPDMALLIQRGNQSGGMVDAKTLQGLQNMGQHLAQHIGLIAQDPQQKARAKQFAQQLGQLMNQLKAFAQRLQAQMKSQAGQNGQGGPDPKKLLDAQLDKQREEQKMALARKSHAQRTAQRDIQFELEMKHKAQEHQLEMVKDAQSHRLDMAKDAAAARQELAINRMKSLSEPSASEE